MNHVCISGKVSGEIVSDIDRNMPCTTFTIKNLYHSDKTNIISTSYIRCIAYGGLAEYCYNELYEGASILVTGRVLNRTYICNNTKIDRLYIGCNTVSKLLQEEYT